TLISGREPLRQIPNMLRSSEIGTFIGAIPGSGGVTSAFLSYREAKRFSRNKEKFGSGELSGVVAPEAGNNGVTGGVMIPLLTLGIPGDAASAVMLGAFLIHGLAPGPALFTDHADVVGGLFVGMLIASVAMLIIGLAAIRLFVKILRIKPVLLFPIVGVLTVVGGYATNSSMLDVVVMLILGVMGYLFSRG